MHASSQVEDHSLVSWAEQSSLIAPTSPDSLSQHPFSQAFNGSYSPAADQGVGLRSLPAFAAHSNSVSQPLSFLRHSVGVSNHVPGSSPFQREHEDQLPSQENELESRLSTSERTMRGGHLEAASRSAGIEALLLGYNGPEDDDRSTPGHVGAVRPSQAPRSESLQSYNHQQDGRESEQAVNDFPSAQSKWQAYLTSVTDNYGLDCGRPDRDLALNNDHAAIDISAALDMINSRGRSEESRLSPTYRSTPAAQNADYSGYYANPVPINIPRYLSPLPSTLLENPINLVYFHHFLNHTSRMLVPHDCDSNPFMSVLPASKLSQPRLSSVCFC